ncbi:MAG: hypothetical protein NVSMB7_07330 [Chitinophagaceae bacterium]
MEKKITSRITKGVIIVCIMIILDIILQVTYKQVPDSTRYLPRLVITFAGILAACLVYSKQSGSNLAFGDIFSHGFRTTAVVAFLMALYTFIAVTWIYPAPAPADMEAAVKAIEQQGNALHEEAKQLAAKAAANRWIVYVSLSIFVSLIPGLLGSLAGAAVTKKNQ